MNFYTPIWKYQFICAFQKNQSNEVNNLNGNIFLSLSPLFLLCSVVLWSPFRSFHVLMMELYCGPDTSAHHSIGLHIKSMQIINGHMATGNGPIIKNLNVSIGCRNNIAHTGKTQKKTTTTQTTKRKEKEKNLLT